MTSPAFSYLIIRRDVTVDQNKQGNQEQHDACFPGSPKISNILPEITESAQKVLHSRRNLPYNQVDTLADKRKHKSRRRVS